MDIGQNGQEFLNTQGKWTKNIWENGQEFLNTQGKWTGNGSQKNGQKTTDCPKGNMCIYIYIY